MKETKMTSLQLTERPKKFDPRLNEVSLASSKQDKDRVIEMSITVWGKHVAKVAVQSLNHKDWKVLNAYADPKREKVYDEFPARVEKVIERSAIAIAKKIERAGLV